MTRRASPTTSRRVFAPKTRHAPYWRRPRRGTYSLWAPVLDFRGGVMFLCTWRLPFFPPRHPPSNTHLRIKSPPVVISPTGLYMARTESPPGRSGRLPCAGGRVVTSPLSLFIKAHGSAKVACCMVAWTLQSKDSYGLTKHRAVMGLRPLASRGGRQSNDMNPPTHGTPCVWAAYYGALKGRCRVAQGHRVAQSGRFEES